MSPYWNTLWDPDVWFVPFFNTRYCLKAVKLLRPHCCAIAKVARDLEMRCESRNTVSNQMSHATSVELVQKWTHPPTVHAVFSPGSCHSFFSPTPRFLVTVQCATKIHNVKNEFLVHPRLDRPCRIWNSQPKTSYRNQSLLHLVLYLANLWS